jgi:hypothetical protein
MIPALLQKMNPLRYARAAGDLLRESRSAASASGRSAARIAFEVIKLRATTGLSRHEYFLYELYNRQTAAEQRAYIPNQGPVPVRVWERLNPRKYWPFFHDKYLFNAAARSIGLPVPADRGFFDPEFGRARDGRPLRTAADLAPWLAENGSDGLVVKPVNGIEGRRVLVFRGCHPERRESLLTLDGQEFTPSDLTAYMTDQAALRREFPFQQVRSFLLEERVRQHPVLQELLGETLCCARVMTLIGTDGQPRILMATMKLQTTPSGVDNMAQGSIIAPIDVDTGSLGEGHDASDPRMPRRRTLPGTGRAYMGFLLPEWRQARQLALSAAAAFPWCRCIGWDIAFAESGPMLIEANERWGPKLAQVPAGRGLLEGELLSIYEGWCS